jgi:hypothetical protein
MLLVGAATHCLIDGSKVMDEVTRAKICVLGAGYEDTLVCESFHMLDDVLDSASTA